MAERDGCPFLLIVELDFPFSMFSILLLNTQITIATSKSVSRMTRIVDKFFLIMSIRKILINNQIRMDAQGVTNFQDDNW